MSDVASVYVTAARFEPSGTAVIEAMAQGLVPIVTEGVGYKNFVKNVDPRLVVTREEDAIDIANKLITNKNLWAKLSLKCKDEVRQLSYKNSVKTFKSNLKDSNII
jgi:glycosyltransferase involved in cell wall biosynthesis